MRPAQLLAVMAAAAALALGACAVAPRPSPSEPPSPAALTDGMSLVPTSAGPPLPSPTQATPTAVWPSATSRARSTITPVGEVRAKRIRIERLGIDQRIVEGDGIDAPIGKAAHYPGSAWPGGGSNIYLYGHARVGMFIGLWDAREGDVVELDLVDGTTRRYVVDRILPKVPWNALEYVRPTDAERLTLQTSTSYYATAPRFIVIAVPEP